MSSHSRVDLSEVDFDYVAKLQKKDASKLRAIIDALEVEGGYPDLVKACKSKLAEIDPSASAHLFSRGPSHEEQKEALADLLSWTSSAKVKDEELKRRAKEGGNGTSSGSVGGRKGGAAASLPVRGHTLEATTAATSTPASSASATATATASSLNLDLGPELDPSTLTPAELSFTARMEKEKGNECFRAQEYTDAIKYYTRSLHLLPSDTTVLNNRAATFLKLKQPDAAFNDVSLVLQQDAHNWKALWRRGVVHESKGFLERALDDYAAAQKSYLASADSMVKSGGHPHPDIAKAQKKAEKTLYEQEPNHPYVQHLNKKKGGATKAAANKQTADDEKESKQQADAPPASSFKRMQIAEVDDEEEEEEEEETAKQSPSSSSAASVSPPQPAAAASGMRRMPIAEVEDDDEDEEDEEEEIVVPVKSSTTASAASATTTPSAATAAPPASAPKPPKSSSSQPAFHSKSGGMMIEVLSDEEE